MTAHDNTVPSLIYELSTKFFSNALDSSVTKRTLTWWGGVLVHQKWKPMNTRLSGTRDELIAGLIIIVGPTDWCVAPSDIAVSLLKCSQT